MVIVAGTTGPTRIDLMRPDGRDRRRIAGNGSSGVLEDVVLLDRFEPLAWVGDAAADEGAGQTLSLYDLATSRTVTVASGVGSVQARNGVLWWSVGDSETMTWDSLDLRTIPPP